MKKKEHLIRSYILLHINGLREEGDSYTCRSPPSDWPGVIHGGICLRTTLQLILLKSPLKLRINIIISSIIKIMIVQPVLITIFNALIVNKLD